MYDCLYKPTILEVLEPVKAIILSIRSQRAFLGKPISKFSMLIRKTFVYDCL